MDPSDPEDDLLATCSQCSSAAADVIRRGRVTLLCLRRHGGGCGGRQGVAGDPAALPGHVGGLAGAAHEAWVSTHEVSSLQGSCTVCVSPVLPQGTCRLCARSGSLQHEGLLTGLFISCRGFRERLLADPTFLVKVGIEVRFSAACLHVLLKAPPEVLSRADTWCSRPSAGADACEPSRLALASSPRAQPSTPSVERTSARQVKAHLVTQHCGNSMYSTDTLYSPQVRRCEIGRPVLLPYGLPCRSLTLC